TTADALPLPQPGPTEPAPDTSTTLSFIRSAIPLSCSLGNGRPRAAARRPSHRAELAPLRVACAERGQRVPDLLELGVLGALLRRDLGPGFLERGQDVGRQPLELGALGRQLVDGGRLDGAALGQAERDPRLTG